MKENLIGHRASLWPRVIALLLIIITAGFVGYAAWQTSLISKEQNQVVVDSTSSQPVETAPEYLYFSAVKIGETEPVTYRYDLDLLEWQPVLNESLFGDLYPIAHDTVVGTMPVSFDGFVEPDEVSPAFVDTRTQEITRLASVPGSDPQWYQSMPGRDTTIAYMQRSFDSTVEDSTIVTDWEVVIDDTTVSTNIVIPGAAYPQWISDTELLLLRAEGVARYDISTGAEVLYETFYDEYTMENQFLLDANDNLLITGLEPDSFGIMSKLDAEARHYLFDEDLHSHGDSHDDEHDHEDSHDNTYGENWYDFTHIIQLENTSFLYPVMSPDQTQFAIVHQKIDPETGEVTGEIAIYNFLDAAPSEMIDLAVYDPATITLLGWQ